MDNEKYGIELELITGKFNRQIEKIKQTPREIQKAFDVNKVDFTINNKETIEGFKTLNNTLKGQAGQLSAIYELKKTLEQRAEGLSYRLWKLGNLCQMMEKYPEKPEDANPELQLKPKKTYAMPDFLKEKWAKQKGYKING